jgi:hypothetical protein
MVGIALVGTHLVRRELDLNRQPRGPDSSWDFATPFGDTRRRTEVWEQTTFRTHAHTIVSL